MLVSHYPTPNPITGYRRITWIIPRQPHADILIFHSQTSWSVGAAIRIDDGLTLIAERHDGDASGEIAVTV